MLAFVQNVVFKKTVKKFINPGTGYTGVVGHAPQQPSRQEQEQSQEKGKQKKRDEKGKQKKRYENEDVPDLWVPLQEGEDAVAIHYNNSDNERTVAPSSSSSSSSSIQKDMNLGMTISTVRQKTQGKLLC